MNTIINKEEFGNFKVLIGWCFGHAIRAIRHHVRSKKFMIESEKLYQNLLCEFGMPLE
jgi:hypothetical protein